VQTVWEPGNKYNKGVAKNGGGGEGRRGEGDRGLAGTRVRSEIPEGVWVVSLEIEGYNEGMRWD